METVPLKSMILTSLLNDNYDECRQGSIYNVSLLDKIFMIIWSTGTAPFPGFARSMKVNVFQMHLSLDLQMYLVYIRLTTASYLRNEIHPPNNVPIRQPRPKQIHILQINFLN